MNICEALIPLYPSWQQLVAFCAVGFLVVMFVLLMQSILTSLVGRIFTAVDKRKNGGA